MNDIESSPRLTRTSKIAHTASHRWNSLISIDYTETGLVTQIDDSEAVDALNAQPRSEGQPVLLRAQSEYVGPGQSVNPVNSRSRAFGNAVACVSTAQDQSEDRLVCAQSQYSNWLNT